jgi:uncharacterized protein
MKQKNILLILLLVMALIIVFYAMQPSGTSEEYKQQILAARKDRDDYMRNNAESPFADSVEAFKGLSYFEPDEKFRISANLIPVENKKTVTLPTSDGLETRYLEYAYAEFSINGEACRLLILEIMDMGPTRGTLFLAFADATSANETYGAGRYLDINKVPGSTAITLDFNKAYNPYCAYNDNFSCPFPPKENILNVAIRAGEKVYH